MQQILTDRASELGVRLEYGQAVDDDSALDADLVVAADGVGQQAARPARRALPPDDHDRPQPLHLARHVRGARGVHVRVRAHGRGLVVGVRLPVDGGHEHVRHRVRAVDVDGARARPDDPRRGPAAAGVGVRAGAVRAPAAGAAHGGGPLAVAALPRDPQRDAGGTGASSSPGTRRTPRTSASARAPCWPCRTRSRSPTPCTPPALPLCRSPRRLRPASPRGDGADPGHGDAEHELVRGRRRAAWTATPSAWRTRCSTGAATRRRGATSCTSRPRSSRCGRCATGSRRPAARCKSVQRTRRARADAGYRWAAGPAGRGSGRGCRPGCPG